MKNTDYLNDFYKLKLKTDKIQNFIQPSARKYLRDNINPITDFSKGVQQKNIMFTPSYTT